MILPTLDDIHASAGYLARSLVLGLLTGLALYLCVNEVVRGKSRVRGLGGPRGWPLVGNLLQVTEFAAQRYERWAATHGDIYQVQLANTTVVVVNGAAAAKKLFGTNTQALSSRPVTYTFHKVASDSARFTIGTSPYDDSLKRRKKGASSALNRPAIQSYVPYIDVETKTFINDLYTSGEAGTVAVDPLPLIQRLSMSLVMTINWGVRMLSCQDAMFQEIVLVEEVLNRVRSTSGNLQDHIPLLRLNPFSSTSAEAKEMRRRRAAYLDSLNGDLDDRIRRGTDEPCIRGNIIKDPDTKVNDVELASISLSMLSGGFETVSNTVHWTMAHLALHPHLQDAAYRAICDFQGGSDAPLCDAADDHKCAYISALVKEALRRFSVVPLALPRKTTKDIVYDGVFIPNDTDVYLNAWACNHDPKLWDQPDEFRPERWLENPDAPLFTFGLGYRMCTAHILAARELYVIFMRLFCSFKVVPQGDIRCDPRVDMKNPRDLIMSAKPYRVLCVPRNKEALVSALSE